MKKDIPERFKPQTFEEKWQMYWEETGIFSPDMRSAQRPYYNLMMFPYPSAEGLHVGNMYAFTGVDVHGRFMRHKGYTVFEPIGLDGFGIHSENYALKMNRHPKKQAVVTEHNFYRQLRATGNAFDWQRTLETYDPDYYRWTQWIFVQMFKHGLAYRAKAEVNWCPSCKTVLADEQVLQGSKMEVTVEVCERCGTEVERKELEQWFFRITAYAEKLLQNTYKPSFKWTNKVKLGQRNWIGKKEGITIKYQVSSIKYQVEVFTTAPVNFGMTFLVLSPDHDLVNKILDKSIQIGRDRYTEVEDYVKQSLNKTVEERKAEGREKTGVFTGLYVINPVNNKKVPVWISDFVVKEVGTGAVQGCPGHDYKDFEFAQKFGIPIPRVVVGTNGDTSQIDSKEKVIAHGMNGTMINSGFLNGMEFEVALQKTMDYFEEKGWGKRVVTYHLRDWLISRQRYWGAPIPMIYCETCAKQGKSWFTTNEATKIASGIRNQESWKNNHNSIFKSHNSMKGWYPVSEDQLPVKLPDVEDWRPTGTGRGPLAGHPEFYQTKCPHCCGIAVRETDVCDTFLDS
ncbi:class I tRNA ligase family protein, partial [Candidatus Gottesmanbacteria bacterium]|nr:class I tRNA ligase family protein [Candidatus Gottesmanbacteria bacterium]